MLSMQNGWANVAVSSTSARQADRKMRNPSAKSLIIGSWTVTSLLLCSAAANALTPLEQLGKHIFFDTSLSTPGNKQGCVSCHEPKKGWTFPDPTVNRTTVVAPGAKPHRFGNLKAPNSNYGSQV